MTTLLDLCGLLATLCLGAYGVGLLMAASRDGQAVASTPNTSTSPAQVATPSASSRDRRQEAVR